MKFPSFSYSRPKTAEQAVSLLMADETARPLAGGQSLLPVLALRLASPGTLVDLGGIAELTAIEWDRATATLRIGAMSTHAANAASALVRAHAPLMTQALKHVAHEAVRNRGTIGGSLVNADASAEMPLVATALDARMVLLGASGEREVSAREFFKGHFTTAIEPGEILVRIDIPSSSANWAFEEVSRRQGDFALAMVATGLSMKQQYCERATVVLGALGDRPLRALVAEAFLQGKNLNEAIIGQAVDIALKDVPSRSDIHASASTRIQITRTLLQRALHRSFQGDLA